MCTSHNWGTGAREKREKEIPWIPKMSFGPGDRPFLIFWVEIGAASQGFRSLFDHNHHHFPRTGVCFGEGREREKEKKKNQQNTIEVSPPLSGTLLLCPLIGKRASLLEILCPHLLHRDGIWATLKLKLGNCCSDCCLSFDFFPQYACSYFFSESSGITFHILLQEF